MKRFHNRCDQGIRRLVRLTHEMIHLADHGDAQRDDVGCGILFGFVRDCAYKIRSLAQTELDEHDKNAQCSEVHTEPSCEGDREIEYKA